jgi:hypothetical protein
LPDITGFPAFPRDLDTQADGSKIIAFYNEIILFKCVLNWSMIKPTI